MSTRHMPAGTKAAILRDVIREKHPKLALPAIASRYGTTYDAVRQIIDANGYPDNAKMRVAAADLELTDEQLPRPVLDPFDPANTQADQHDHQTPAGGHAPDVAADPSSSPWSVGTEREAVAAAPPAGPDDEDDMGQLVRVKVVDLQADPDNLRETPRLDDPGIVELAESIAEVGLLQPITARRHNGRLVVVMGHRRLQAVRRLKWTTVRVIVRGPMLAEDVIAAMLVENGQRKDLNPIEEARGLHLLKTRENLSDQELAGRVGRSQPYVSGRLVLLSLSAEDQAAIVAGDMTLVEGTNKGRINSGRVRPTGQDKNWHLGPNHNLALAAKARCHRLGHPKGRRVGGMACGECWESVIRADARQDFVDISQRSGSCAICDQPVERQVEPLAVGR